MGSSAKVARKQPIRAQEPGHGSGQLGADGRKASDEIVEFALDAVDPSAWRSTQVGRAVVARQRAGRVIICFAPEGAYLGTVPEHVRARVQSGRYRSGAVVFKGEAVGAIRVRLTRAR